MIILNTVLQSLGEFNFRSFLFSNYVKEHAGLLRLGLLFRFEDIAMAALIL